MSKVIILKKTLGYEVAHSSDALLSDFLSELYKRKLKIYIEPEKEDIQMAKAKKAPAKKKTAKKGKK